MRVSSITTQKMNNHQKTNTTKAYSQPHFGKFAKRFTNQCIRLLENEKPIKYKGKENVNPLDILADLVETSAENEHYNIDFPTDEMFTIVPPNESTSPHKKFFNAGIINAIIRKDVPKTTKQIQRNLVPERNYAEILLNALEELVIKANQLKENNSAALARILYFK